MSNIGQYLHWFAWWPFAINNFQATPSASHASKWTKVLPCLPRYFQLFRVKMGRKEEGEQWKSD